MSVLLSNEDNDGISLCEAWDRVRTATDRITTSQECSVCKYRGICTICPAMLWTEKNSLDIPPDYVCEFTKWKVKIAEEEYGNTL